MLLFMKTRIFRARRAVLPLALLAAFPWLAHGQATSSLKETVVTATRVPQPLSDLVADVTILDRETIERSGAVGLVEVLARVPGIEFSRNGGPGAATNLFVRGAESRFTAVFIDGVRIDSQSTGGATWENIPLAQIDRIEILRGPAGAVYGSDALSGVIQIFTKRGEGAFTPSFGIGFGTYGTQKIEAGFSGSDGSIDYSLGLARQSSDGFNARPTAVPVQNPDTDGYTQQSFNARMGFQLSPGHRLEATALSTELNSQYDSAASLNRDDRNIRSLQALGLNWKAQWNAIYSTRVSITDSRDRYETRPSPYLSLTHLNSYLFQNEFRVGAQLITAALERKVDQLENAPVNRDRSQDALALGYGWTSPQHTVQFNLRQDQDSEFGTQNTGSAAYGFALTPQWRLTASAGSAFRAPTLFQRFSSFGLATLQPETGRNVEAGVRYTQGSSSWGAVVYRNAVSNLITFVSNQGTCPNNTPPTTGASPGCYFNTAQAEYLGVTISGQQRLGDVDFRASLDVQDPRDQTTGKMLIRRANQHATLGISTRISGWSMGADTQLSGLRYDDAANTIALPGYVLLNLHAQTRVAKDWTALVRVDNATDTAYQLVNTYATPGRTLYVGLKWEPQPSAAK
jgi:vitamin B12 transporter